MHVVPVRLKVDNVVTRWKAFFENKNCRRRCGVDPVQELLLFAEHPIAVIFVNYLRHYQLDWRIQVGATHCFVGKSRVDLVECKAHRLSTVDTVRKGDHSESAGCVLVAQLVLLVVVVVEANRCDVEELVVVFKRNPEDAVVLVRKVGNLPFAVLGPQLRVV